RRLRNHVLRPHGRLGRAGRSRPGRAAAGSGQNGRPPDDPDSQRDAACCGLVLGFCRHLLARRLGDGVGLHVGGKGANLFNSATKLLFGIAAGALLAATVYAFANDDRLGFALLLGIALATALGGLVLTVAGIKDRAPRWPAPQLVREPATVGATGRPAGT